MSGFCDSNTGSRTSIPFKCHTVYNFSDYWKVSWALKPVDTQQEISQYSIVLGEFNLN